MGFWQPVTNIRDFTSQNPPVVTFFLCLLTLAISFISLGSYSYSHTLPNPDTEKEWNHLLSSLAQLQLCEKPNASSSSKRDTSVQPAETYSRTSLRFKVLLAVAVPTHSDSLNGFGLHATLRAKQLDLGGNEIINVTLEFVSGNHTFTCLTINAPTHLLPTSIPPAKCPTSEENFSPIYVEASNQLPTASQTCYRIHSKNDPTLTVMLQQEEQNVAVRHLLEFSMCLLGVCLGLCVFASLTQSLTRRYHLNRPDLQNELLSDT